MKITIDISSEEAELLIWLAAVRSRQKNLPPSMQNDAVNLGERLNTSFEKQFGWGKFDRVKNTRNRVKSMSIKAYDLAPND